MTIIGNDNVNDSNNDNSNNDDDSNSVSVDDNSVNNLMMMCICPLHFERLPDTDQCYLMLSITIH